MLSTLLSFFSLTFGAQIESGSTTLCHVNGMTLELSAAYDFRFLPPSPKHEAARNSPQTICLYRLLGDHSNIGLSSHELDLWTEWSLLVTVFSGCHAPWSPYGQVIDTLSSMVELHPLATKMRQDLIRVQQLKEVYHREYMMLVDEAIGLWGTDPYLPYSSWLESYLARLMSLSGDALSPSSSSPANSSPVQSLQAAVTIPHVQNEVMKVGSRKNFASPEEELQQKENFGLIADQNWNEVPQEFDTSFRKVHSRNRIGNILWNNQLNITAHYTITKDELQITSTDLIGMTYDHRFSALTYLIYFDQISNELKYLNELQQSLLTEWALLVAVFTRAFPVVSHADKVIWRYTKLVNPLGDIVHRRKVKSSMAEMLMVFAKMKEECLGMTEYLIKWAIDIWNNSPDLPKSSPINRYVKGKYYLNTNLIKPVPEKLPVVTLPIDMKSLQGKSEGVFFAARKPVRREIYSLLSLAHSETLTVLTDPSLISKDDDVPQAKSATVHSPPPSPEIQPEVSNGEWKQKVKAFQNKFIIAPRGGKLI